MRSLAIVGRDCSAWHGAAQRGTLTIEGMSVRCAIVEVPPPEFDPHRQRESVLLRVCAFSLNYRDRALILQMCASTRQDGFYIIGSDFVGEVLAVGDDVSDLVPGDRVIGDGAWPPTPGRRGGIPTNHGSREIHVMSRDRLFRIPEAMELTVAAAFSIGGQTSFGMVRRLALSAGNRVLVTAPHSNTALFMIAALAPTGVEIHGVATNERQREALLAAGLTQLIVANPWAGPLSQNPGFTATQADGGYDAVVDPFYDLYFAHTVPLLGFGGRYITCGHEDQSSPFTGQKRTPVSGDTAGMLALMMVRNLNIMGNCLGSTDDLARAVAEHAAGRFPVRIDSIYQDNDPAGFLERTYNTRERFGKVVFAYR